MSPRVHWRAAAGLLGLACVYTLANAAKPLHVDDPLAFYVARQIASAPLDPFGLEVFWWQWPQPLYECLLTPFMGYWGALGRAALGADPFWWKLSLLPLVALFGASLFALARRFAPRLEWPLLVATLFSPALLPSLNYMADVPALALGLGGLVLYLRAEERESALGAVAAGLMAGLALQTKYTAFASVGAIVVHGLLWRRWRLGFLAAATALAVFALWEVATTLRYGHSMFLGTLLSRDVWWASRLQLPRAVVQLLGFTLPGVGLLGLATLGLRNRVVVALGLAVLLGHGLLLAGPIPRQLPLGFGALVAAAGVGAAALQLRGVRAASLAGWIEARREALFLALWLGGETLQCLLISPFPAVRRVLGLAVVLTLVIGRAAALRPGRRPLPLLPLVGLQLALGILYFQVDLLEARAQREAVEEAHRVIRAVDPEGSIWFLGHWGFQFYAEGMGMQPVIPDHSRLRPGDWLLVPDRVDQQAVAAARSYREVSRVVVDDGLPLATLDGFYAGAVPLAHRPGPRLLVRLYRARRETVPESGWTLGELARYTRSRGSQAGWATRALARELRRLPDPRDRRAAAGVLGALGSRAAEARPALAESAARDPDPSVRAAACGALRRIDPTRTPDACAALR